MTESEEQQDQKDSTVQPASHMMSYSAAFEKIFSTLSAHNAALTAHNISIQALMSIFEENQQELQAQIISLSRKFEAHYVRTEGRLNSLEGNDN